jgi:hypothetical protein
MAAEEALVAPGKALSFGVPPFQAWKSSSHSLKR